MVWIRHVFDHVCTDDEIRWLIDGFGKLTFVPSAIGKGLLELGDSFGHIKTDSAKVGKMLHQLATRPAPDVVYDLRRGCASLDGRGLVGDQGAWRRAVFREAIR